MKKTNILKEAYKETKTKQTTRMLKCFCSSCNYILRTSRANTEKAIPVCPLESCNKYLSKMNIV
jgi:hypothetical protein